MGQKDTHSLEHNGNVNGWQMCTEIRLAWGGNYGMS